MAEDEPQKKATKKDQDKNTNVSNKIETDLESKDSDSPENIANVLEDMPSSIRSH